MIIVYNNSNLYTTTGLKTIDDLYSEIKMMVEKELDSAYDESLVSFTYETQEEKNHYAVLELSRNDWKVIRELERLYLSDTDLNVERETLRSLVVEE